MKKYYILFFLFSLLIVCNLKAATGVITYDTDSENINRGSNAVRKAINNIVGSGSFTIALIPDTQNISFNNTNVFAQMTTWLETNRTALNLVAVLGLGDCVEHQGTSEPEWGVASNAYNLITNVPTLVPPGNHDYDTFSPRDLTHFNTYFTEGFYTNRSWFDGDFYQSGHRENVYCLATNGNIKMLFFCIRIRANN